MAEIFVIYYHKILPKWGFDVFYKTFDLEIRILKSLYKIVTLDEIYYYIKEDKRPDKPSIAITFDDGYADNYIYAYPILKKHKVKATVFPIVSRILKKDLVRPSIEDYWNNKVSFQELYKPKTMAQANLEFLRNGESEDFLTVEELNKIKDIFEIGGHGSVHSRVFYGENIIDFYDGKNGHWSFLYAYEEEPVIGFPILESKNNISVNRSFIKKEVKDFIKSLDKYFFNQKNWKEKLKELINKNFQSIVIKETDEERRLRIKKEIEESKNQLENLIGKKIRHFAYPFGHYDDLSINVVKEFFDTAFTTEKSSLSKNTDLHKIPRFAIPKDISSFLAVLLKAKL